ncbi:MAG TPA: IS200/IS605 family accessory protein TnpB-related protein [Nevskiaceae bacterium]|nr:IS200/IS605 family accessory protein TnpB-related protein [Nevskiaceae bacterium]
MASIIRTDRWKLKPSSTQRLWIRRTQAEYRAYVQALIGVVWVRWPTIATAGSQCVAVEALVHATSKRPAIRYPYFDRHFRKFPSYLRRAAIRAAVGQVASFATRYDRWQGGVRQRRTVAPPRRTGVNAINPALYRGQNVKFDKDYTVASIKVWNGTDWVWADVPITGKRRRHEASANKALSPTLLVQGDRTCLAVPFKIPKVWPSASDAPVCAVDLGINTTATASIVHSDGTVTARRFVHRAADIDRRDRGLVRIRGRARKTAKLSRGFCRALYRKAQHRNLELSRQVARELVAFAQANEAAVMVFEHLKGWRPRGGQARSTLRQRFHGWLHRALVKRVQAIAEEVGLRVGFVNPKNTSALAFDGSGPLSRDSHNAALATFKTGKHYNADLSASYNIGARYWYQRLTGGNDRQARLGGSPRSVPGIRVTLSTLWELANAGTRTTVEVGEALASSAPRGADAATTTA